MTVAQDIEKLKAIQKAGVKTITIDGQEITYMNNDELTRIIAGLNRGSVKRSTVFNPYICVDGKDKC